MLNFLVGFTVFLAFLLILSVVFVARMARDLSKSLTELTGRIDKLTTRVADQAREIEELRADVRRMNVDPVQSVTKVVNDWRSKGPLAALGLVASRLVQIYFVKRRRSGLGSSRAQKELPNRRGQEN